MASLTVVGFGVTTATAYADALALRDDLTAGDVRPWVISDQSYSVGKDKGEPPHVRCELTLELIETMAND